MPLVHQGEEQTDLNRLYFNVIQLIDEKGVIGQVALDDLVFGMVGHGSKELGDQVGKQDVAAGMPSVNGLDQETGGQPRFAASGGPHPDNVLFLGHEIEGVVQGQDLFLVQPGLLVEGKGLQDVGIGYVGAQESELAGIVALDLALLFQDVLQQPDV